LGWVRVAEDRNVDTRPYTNHKSHSMLHDCVVLVVIYVYSFVSVVLNVEPTYMRSHETDASNIREWVLICCTLIMKYKYRFINEFFIVISYGLPFFLSRLYSVNRLL